MPETARPTFGARHDTLTRFLLEHREIWHPRPFLSTQPLPWEVSHPSVVAYLDARPDADFEPGATPDFADAPEPLATWAREAALHAALPPLASAGFRLEVRAARGIPGHKRAQLEAFVGCVLGRRGGAPEAPGHTHVLDWCAGKGHLGRALAGASPAAGGAPLVAVEWDATLAAAGQAWCDAQKRPAVFHVLDARGPEAATLVRPGALAVALHACGGLHAALLRAAVANGVAHLAVAPCCYNRAERTEDLVLSQGGRTAGLDLDAHDLDLLHRVEVQAGAGERRRMRLGLARRLAFDLWQREARGTDTYRPMPNFPAAWLALPFPEFAVRFAALGEVEPPPGSEIAAYEPRGEARLAAVLRRDAVRGLFARALEVWLLLDRARLLEDAGYVVALGTFCPVAQTPRNALLLASRAPTAGRSPAP